MRSASAIASGTISSPQTSPACFGHRQPDRADPAVEVEEPLAAAEAGELGGDPVEALGHLGVGLEEGVVGDLQVEPAELLAQALLADRAGRAVGPARVALDHGVEVDRAASAKRAEEVTSRVWIWPVRRPSRTTRLRRIALALAAVVGGDHLASGPVADLVAGRVAGLGGELAVLDSDDPVPAAAGVEAEGRLALDLAEGVLELVAVAPLFDGGDDLLEARSPRGRRSASAPRRPARCLCGELALVGEPLPGRAGAGLAFVDAAVGDPVAARLQQLDRVVASAKRRFFFVTSARTRSPGRAPETKTTRPSARATPRPPKASESISSSS